MKMFMKKLRFRKLKNLVYKFVLDIFNPQSKQKRARWDRHFLSLCYYHSKMSQDPNTKLGSVIVGPDREIRSMGFNGFPRGVKDTPDRLNDRDTKLQLIIHAECNAIIQAARVGVSLNGCTMYLTATDASGDIWGGPPCVRCSVHAIQAGIKEIVSLPKRKTPSKWHAEMDLAESLLEEAGVVYRVYTP